MMLLLLLLFWRNISIFFQGKKLHTKCWGVRRFACWLGTHNISSHFMKIVLLTSISLFFYVPIWTSGTHNNYSTHDSFPWLLPFAFILLKRSIFSLVIIIIILLKVINIFMSNNQSSENNDNERRTTKAS